MSPSSLLLLLLSSLFPVALALVRAGTQNTTNYDLLNAKYPPYLVNGTIMEVNFAPASPCLVEISKNSTLSLIPLVIWEDASAFGCSTFRQVIEQIVSQDSFPLLLFSSVDSTFDTNYGWKDQRKEPYGPTANIAAEMQASLGSAKLTLISNHTAEFLRVYNGSVLISNEIASGELFFASVGWLFLNWFLFSVWLLTFCYTCFEICLFVYEQKRIFWNIKLSIYFFGALSATLRMIECSVDPTRSTTLLGLYPYNFVYWFSYLFMFYSIVALLKGWLTILISVTDFPGVRVLNHFLWIIIPCLSFGMIFQACAVQSTFVLVIVSCILYVLLILMAVATAVSFLYLGISLLKMLQTDVFGNGLNDPMNRVRKQFYMSTTYMMISAISFFLVLLATMVVYIILSGSDVIAFTVSIRITFDIGLLGIFLSMLISLRFRQHRNTNKLSSQSSKTVVI